MDWFDGAITDKAKREPKPEVGKHLIVISALEPFKTRDYGRVPKMTARILKSETDRVGKEVGDIWFVNAQGFAGRYAKGDWLNCMKAVHGSIGGDGNEDAAKALARKLYFEEESQKSQPARGVVLEVEVTRDDKGYVQCKYAPVPGQTRDTIKARRDQLTEWEAGAGDLPDGQSQEASSPPADPAPSAPPASSGMLDGLEL